MKLKLDEAENQRKTLTLDLGFLLLFFDIVYLLTYGVI
jgi:hypothetical protein